MNNEQYKQANQQFDVRYSRLLKAGYTKHVMTSDIGYSRPFEIHGLTGRRSVGIPVFISNSDLMWKPLDAFDTDIQAILGE